MSLLDQLSSSRGDRTEASNRRVAARLIENSARLPEIAHGLASPDRKLAGDCAEVLTKVAAVEPRLVAPFAQELIARLDDPDTRVRWEVVHSLAEIAATAPDRILPILPRLDQMMANDQSVIVRDWAVLTLGEYGRTSAAAAQRVWLSLRKALTAWKGKQAGKALVGMQKLVQADSRLKADGRRSAERFVDDPSPSVRMAAKRLLKLCARE